MAALATITFWVILCSIIILLITVGLLVKNVYFGNNKLDDMEVIDEDLEIEGPKMECIGEVCFPVQENKPTNRVEDNIWK